MAGRPIVFWYFKIFSETMCAIGLLQCKYVPYKTSIIHVGNYFVVLQNQWTIWKQIWLQCSLNGLIQNIFFWVRVDQNSKMAAIVGHSFNIITYGKKMTIFFLNCNLIELTVHEISPDSSKFQFLCRLEIQDGHHRRIN